MQRGCECVMNLEGVVGRGRKRREGSSRGGESAHERLALLLLADSRARRAGRGGAQLRRVDGAAAAAGDERVLARGPCARGRAAHGRFRLRHRAGGERHW